MASLPASPPPPPPAPGTRTGFLCLLVILATSFAAFALEPYTASPRSTSRPTATAPTPAEISRLITQLGDPDFDTRERAAAALWQAGRPAAPAVQAATQSSDPEIALRAESIWSRFRIGVFADTPPEMAILVLDFDATHNSQSFIRLMQSGPRGYNAALLFLTQEHEPEARKRLQKDLRLWAKDSLTAMILKGEDDHVESILRQTNDVQGLASFLLARGRLDAQIKQLQQSGEDPALLACFERTAGDYQGALRTAARIATRPMERMSKDMQYAVDLAREGAGSRLHGILLADLGRWKELLDLERAGPPGDTPSDHGRRAYLNWLVTGRYDESEMKQIERAPKDQKQWTDDEEANSAWFNLERYDDGLRMLGRDNTWSSTNATIRLTRMNAAESVRVARQDAVRGEERFGTPHGYIALAHILWRLGERDEARRATTRAATRAASFDADLARSDDGDERADFTATPGVAAEYFGAGDIEEAADTIAGLPARWTNTPVFDRLLGGVGSKPSGEPEAWIWYFRARYPSDDPRALAGRVLHALDERTPTEALRANLGDALRLARVAQTRDAAWSCKRLAERARTAGLAELRAELAVEAARLLAEHPDTGRNGFPDRTEPSLRALFCAAAGDAMGDLGRRAEAADLYEQACAASPTEANLRWRLARALDALDRHDEAAKQRALGERILAVNPRDRTNLVVWLDQLGDHENAAQQIDLCGRSSVTSQWADEWIARYAEAAGDLPSALRAVQRKRLDLDMNWVEEVLRLVTRERRLRAQIAIGERRWADANEQVNHALAALPGDVTLVMRLTPMFAKGGREADAKALFERVRGTYERVIKDFPNDWIDRTAVAWLCARCGRDLDAGLAHAQKAVELAPRDAKCFAALAECEFQLGRRDAAIEHGKKCVELEPASTLYRAQLERFTKGDPASEPSGEVTNSEQD